MKKILKYLIKASDSICMENKEKNLFEEAGLEVKYSEVEVGQVYPIYGMVTDIIENQGEDLKIVVNWSILLTIYKVSDEKKDLIKGRAFEPGIFLSKITNKIDTLVENDVKYSIEGECSTVVFGKKQTIEV